MGDCDGWAAGLWSACGMEAQESPAGSAGGCGSDADWVGFEWLRRRRWERWRRRQWERWFHVVEPDGGLYGDLDGAGLRKFFDCGIDDFYAYGELIHGLDGWACIARSAGWKDCLTFQGCTRYDLAALVNRFRFALKRVKLSCPWPVMTPGTGTF